MKTKTYERTIVCELCGQQFKVTNKHSRPKRCPECAAAITGRHYEAGSRKKKRNVSELDTLAREARSYNMSYGKYMGLKRAGYKMKRPQKNMPAINRADEWRQELYAIVEQCRYRTERRGLVQ